MNSPQASKQINSLRMVIDKSMMLDIRYNFNIIVYDNSTRGFLRGAGVVRDMVGEKHAFKAFSKALALYQDKYTYKVRNGVKLVFYIK